MRKSGRNDNCPCGSGKKYKKCCLSRDIIVANKNSNQNSPSTNILVKTLTDELYQPMRLYYIVHKKEQLITCFQNMKCFNYDEKLNDWVVEYSHEAAHIGLKVKPNQVPKEAQPLIIATLYIDNETTMLVDVRSIERATKLIEFINQHIPKAIAEITHAAIYNKLITVSSDEKREEVRNIDHDEIFSQGNVFVVDPEKTMREAKAIAKKYKNKDEGLSAMMQKTQDDAKKPLPLVEKFPVYYYEEGIESFSMTCLMRQMIAMKHYFGDVGYSFYDLIQESLSKGLDKFQMEGGWIKKSENITEEEAII